MADPLLQPIQLSARDYCPCESGNRIEKCSCLISGAFRPRVVMVAPPDPHTGHSHPGCYLRGDNNCGTQLSREHFISESILELIEVANGELMVGGFPWLREPKPLPPSALASRVLCRRHNEALSPLDSVALRFYRRLSNPQAHLRAPRGRRDKVYLFSGPDLERWMLKVLCGLLASGNAATSDGTKVVMQPPADWLDVLMGRKRLPPHLGLSVTSRVGDSISLASGVGFAATFANDGRVVGAIALINGLGFAVHLANITDKTGTVLEHAVFHPKEITFRSPSARVILLLAGDGWTSDAGIQIDWKGDGPSPHESIT